MSGERVAIVTGGAAGIGRASALRLADECRAVVVVDLAAEAPAVAAEIEERECESLVVGIDVSDAQLVESAAQRVLATFGRIDILVNCAGILGPEDSVRSIDEATVRRVFDTNFYGVFHWCRAVLGPMESAGWGRIVSITSGARHGQELRTAYSSSKAAMSAFMRTLALETAQTGVLANCIEPGRTLTNMVIPRFSAEFLQAPTDTPMRRYADPEEIAEVVAFLCSESCTFATGATFNISGGAI